MSDVSETEQLKNLFQLLTTLTYSNMKEIKQYNKLNFTSEGKSIKQIIYSVSMHFLIIEKM